MPEENPFDKLLDQLTDLIALTQDEKENYLKGDLPEDIDKQLGELEAELEIFKIITDKALQGAGIGNEWVNKAAEEPPSTLSKSEQRILKRTEKLKKEMEKIEKDFSKQRMFIEMLKKKAKTAGKKRKKKFKKLGGARLDPLIMHFFNVFRSTLIMEIG